MPELYFSPRRPAFRTFDVFRLLDLEELIHRDHAAIKPAACADLSERVGDKASVALKGLASLYVKGVSTGFASLLLGACLVVADHA